MNRLFNFIVRPAAIGAFLLPVLVYLFAAFIEIDWNWMRGMFTTWSKADRAFFFLMALAFPLIGFLLGQLIELELE